MPRKKANGRGGPREGAPGTAYQNRRDLNTAQPPRAGPSQEYGSRVAQERAQQQIPLPATPPAGGSQVAAAPSPAGPLPGSLGPLDAPTARPGEPVTAGMDMGAGPGSEVLSRGGGNPNDPLSMLRVLYQAYPYDEIRELLEKADEQAYDEALAAPPQRDVATQMGTQGAPMATRPATP